LPEIKSVSTQNGRQSLARHYLEQAMRVTGNNKARAARLLGFGNATTLTNWLKRHGAEP
jgi:DNA-binding protein Fis